MIDPGTPEEFNTGSPPKQIEFTHLPNVRLLTALDAHLSNHPDTVVRFFGNEGDWTSLAFLQHIPHVQRLRLQNSDSASPISDLSPLGSIATLRDLNIPWVAKRKIDFTPLLRHSGSLRNLSIWVERTHRHPYFDVLPRLTSVRLLGLPFADFRLLTALERLAYLNLGAGPFENETSVEGMADLQHVRMLRSKITDLTPYLTGRSIRSIELLKMPNCGVRHLPQNSAADFVYIDGFKSLESFKSLGTFPRLSSLVIRTPHLPPSDFSFLQSCSALQQVFVEFPSKKQSSEFASHVDANKLLDGPVFPDIPAA
jgi:hypothetical protein